MPIKGENGGYKYKAFINGEWHDLTLSDSPNELIEWLQSNEEWTRVKHGHWIAHGKSIIGIPVERCSECAEWSCGFNQKYCPKCGAKMDEVEDGKV